MGLMYFSYIAIASMLFAITRVRTKSSAAFAFRIASLCSIVYATSLISAYLFATRFSPIALILLRIAAISASFSYMWFFLFALSYPGRKINFIALIAVLVLSAIEVWVIAFSDMYVTDLKRVVNEIILFEGNMYSFISFADGLFVVASFTLVFFRAVYEENKVYRQQFLLLGIGFVINFVWKYLVSFIVSHKGLEAIYPLGGIDGLPIILLGMYAFGSTRVFQWKAMAYVVFIWVLSYILIAFPVGLVSGIIFRYRDTVLLTIIAAGGVMFFFLGHSVERFAGSRVGAQRNEAFREKLESEIVHIDLSEGREKALSELSKIMSTYIGCSTLISVSENEDGSYQKVFPDDMETEIVAANSPIIETLSEISRNVILKTDLYTLPDLIEKNNILEPFFDVLEAEALILAKEGNHVLGILALGPKKSGADYDAVDYETLDAIQGKLFVVAYYARHVERESLLDTVEQEIGLADQIVKAIQQNIDPVIHPGAKLAWRCESPRGLGGDLFDAVRISTHRWFFVVGDISGKGLNASMSMIIFKSFVRTLLKEEKDFIKLVARANTFIKERLPRGTFFSGMFGFLALDKGSVYFINCGIPAMFYRSPGLDSVIEAQGEGKMLGFVRNIEPFLKTRKLSLLPGSRLVITTDGIVEAESIRGEHYGKERLARIIAENNNTDAKGMVDAIIKSASSFVSGKLDDDITVICIDYAGRAVTKESRRQKVDRN